MFKVFLGLSYVVTLFWIFAAGWVVFHWNDVTGGGFVAVMVTSCIIGIAGVLAVKRKE